MLRFLFDVLKNSVLYIFRQNDDVAEEVKTPQVAQISVAVNSTTETEIVHVDQYNETPNIGRPVTNNNNNNNTSNLNYNYKFFCFTIYILFLPILIIYAIFLRIFSFIYRHRCFFILVCIIILILPPTITLSVYFIMYNRYHHRQHHHEYTDDPIKVELSNMTLYQFDVQPTLSYNVSLSLDIINYHSITPLNITTNISLSYYNITLDSISFQSFYIDSGLFKNLHFTSSGNNTYFNSTSYDFEEYICFYLLIHSSIEPLYTQSRISDKAYIYDVGCDINITEPPDGTMTAFHCSGL